MLLTLFALLAGILLGLRFKMAVLIPALPVYLLIAIGSGMAHADTAGWTALVSIAGGTALQIGYLAGTAFRIFRPDRSTASFSSPHASRRPASGNAR
jgi:hypothetical protein